MQFSRVISAADARACGEPRRVIIGGVLDVPGKTMFEKKVYLETRADDLRNLMVDVVLPTRNGLEVRKRCISQPTEHKASADN